MSFCGLPLSLRRASDGSIHNFLNGQVFSGLFGSDGAMSCITILSIDTGKHDMMKAKHCYTCTSEHFLGNLCILQTIRSSLCFLKQIQLFIDKSLHETSFST